MANIPTISELYSQILNDLRTELGITATFWGKIYLRAQAAVHAGRLKLLYLFAASVQKNVFPDLADEESKGGTLERFGRIILGRDRFPASAGKYVIDIVGDIGATIPINTTFKSDDSSLNPQKLFILDAAYVLVATNDQITLRATEVGVESKLDIGNTLTATAPLINVNDQGTVASEDTAPIAAEDIEDYRTKILTQYRLEAQGGARADYRLWTADVSGLRTVYPYAVSGDINELDIYIEAESDSSDPIGSGIPPASMVIEVAAVIEFDPDTTKPLNERGRRPATVIVNYFDIVPLNVDINIYNLNDSSQTEKDAIENTVKAYLNDIRPYIAGADDPNNIQDTLYLSNLISVINSAISSGNSFTKVEFSVNGVPSDTRIFTNGDIPLLNTITYL